MDQYVQATSFRQSLRRQNIHKLLISSSHNFIGTSKILLLKWLMCMRSINASKSHTNRFLEGQGNFS